jgi:serine kinase of HPr protein (carbohydrate metabolism regulator)
MMISSGSSPKRMMNADTMMPVKVKEVMACRERLGITHLWYPHGVSDSVSRVCIRPREEAIRTPLPRTIMIFPPTSSDGRVSTADIGRLSPLSRRNISCAAFSEANELPDNLKQFSEAQRIPVFTSCYHTSLLKSRLTGLLREKGRRQIMLHGVLIQLSGQGILMTGDSGIGKTSCSVDLVDRGGFWIADDAVILEGRGDALCGRGHYRTRNLIAVRGRGILDARDLLGAGAVREETRVNLIIRFVRDSGKDGTTRGDEGSSILEIMGIPVLCRRLEAGDGPRQMSDQVMKAVDELLLAVEHRRSLTAVESGVQIRLGVTDDEAATRDHHYGVVRFR